MIRSQLGSVEFWNKWTSFSENSINECLEQISEPSGNPVYRPQFVWDLSLDFLRLILRRYSRGNAISDLAEHFLGLLDTWERSNALADEVCAAHGLTSCRDWTFSLSNLNHYNWCFWLVGLALALEIPNEQWQRLLALIGGEGEDVLLDRVIASRQPARQVGAKLLHPKPYARLLKAIDAQTDVQAELLRDFVEHWYPELARKGKAALWWYDYGDPVKHPLEMGSYFGRWCIEAVAAVKAFGLDDRLCLGHEHYPGDLLRPNGASTHPVRADAQTSAETKGFKEWFSRLLGRTGT